MDKKRKHFHGFHWYWVPTKGWKETCFLKKKLDSVLKLRSTGSPASVLNLKMWILKMRGPQAKNFEFLKTQRGGSAHYGDTFIISWNSNISHSLTWRKTWGKGPKWLKILNKWAFSISLSTPACRRISQGQLKITGHATSGSTLIISCKSNRAKTCRKEPKWQKILRIDHFS